MNLDQIFKLIDAGYTQEDIQQLTQPAPEPEKKEDPAPEQAQEQAQEPEKKPEEEPFDTQPFTRAIDEMSKAMDAMNVKLQRMALSMYEAPGRPDKTVESIIAKIVDPKG